MEDIRPSQYGKYINLHVLIWKTDAVEVLFSLFIPLKCDVHFITLTQRFIYSSPIINVIICNIWGAFTINFSHFSEHTLANRGVQH